MLQKNIVRLKIRSVSITPEEIESTLMLRADRSWHIGTTRPKTIIREKDNGWLLESALPQHVDLEDHIASLAAKLRPMQEHLQAIARNATIEMSCVIYAEHEPALYFSVDTIQALGELGAGLDIDLYIGAEPDSEPHA